MQGPGALGSCARPLQEAYDAALLDLDGVVYVGAEAVPHARDALVRARDAGMRLAYVTNNASRRAAAVAEHLQVLGMPARAEDVVTSAQAAARYLAARLDSGSPVLVVGTESLAEEVEAAGLRPVRSAESVVAVVQGLDPGTTWSDLAEATIAIGRGALWVAGNRDLTYPTERGRVLGNGALVAALEAATGRRAVVVGKPEPELHEVSLQRLQARRPLVVGDRLDTDVLGANRAGTDSLLVLTGVTSAEELLAAPPELRPTYVAPDLRALAEPQEEVLVAEGDARCGTARAWVEGEQVLASGPEPQALRARCALAWGSGHA